MNIINLPRDIFPGEKTENESIIMHDYTAENGSLRGRSILHRNAISLVITGEKTMHFADKTVNIKDDEFHFISSGNCLASINLSSEKIFRSILVFFDDKTLADFYLKYDKQVEVCKKKIIPEAHPYLAFKKDDFVLNFIHSLGLLFKTSKQISLAMRQLKFEELMLHLLERYPEQILSFKANKSRDFDDLQIRNAVETNIVNNISIEELAFLCNISASTFKRRFTSIYGTSPSRWKLAQKMKMAKDLLQHHHEKPAEIFHKLGYENHSSFSQSFKQAYGLTPKEFQVQYLNQ